jgi:CBS domain-containing protein
MSDALVPVRAAMTAAPLTIDGLASIRDALETMRARGISALVVDRRDEGDEYGLLLIADIAREIVAVGRSLERVSVYEVMIKPALCLHGEMNLRYAARLMARLSTTHALVMEGRDLAGIVTLRDLTLRHFESAHGPRG